MLVPEREPWMDEAACPGMTHLFHDKPGERAVDRAVREQEAKKVCRGCPVMGECRSYARRAGEYGFWGGESEEERIDAGYPPRSPRTVRRYLEASA